MLCREGSLARMEALIQRWGSDRVVPVVGDLSAEALGVDHGLGRRAPRRDRPLLPPRRDLRHDRRRRHQRDAERRRHPPRPGAGRRRSRSGCFHQVSSVAAAGEFRGVFDETMFDEGQHLPSPYHRTKYESEKIVRDGGARVPWRVYRPAIVVGHSETGAMDKVDGPYYFFPLMKLMRDNLPGLAAAGRRRPRRHQRGAGRLRRQGDGPPRAPARPRRRGLPPGQPRAAAGRRDDQRVLHGRRRADGSPPRSTGGSTAGCRWAAPAARCGSPGQRRGQGRRRLQAGARPDHRPARHPGRGARPHRRSPPVFDSRRTEKALAGSGIAVPDLEGYARTLWGYWEENLDEATGRDPRNRAALQGKYVVITGASSGIGQVTALKVAQAGGIPVLVARGKDKLEDTRAAIERARRHRARLPVRPLRPRGDRHALRAADDRAAVGRLRGQQRRPLDPPLAASCRTTASTTSSAPCSSTTSARSGWSWA